MKGHRCTKCDDNQRKAGEALSLFTECQGTLLDLENILADVEAMMLDQHERDELSESEEALLVRVRAARAAALTRNEGKKVLACL